MIRGRIRTTLRLHRFELVAFGLAFLVFAGGTVLAAMWIATLTPPLGCFGIEDGSESPTILACRVTKRAFDEAVGMTFGLTAPLLAITFVVGLFLGVPLVARELERGTTRLTWSLVPSRWRWYVTTVAPIAAILLLFAFAGGAALDRFFAAARPTVDAANSFEGYGARGGLGLAARAFFIFGIGVAMGAIVGRSWPALIVGAIVVTIALGAGERLHQDMLLRSEAVLAGQSDGSYDQGDLYIDQRIELPDGTLVGWEYFSGDDQELWDENGNPRYPMYDLVVPGERYRFVEAREAAILFLGGLVAVAVGGVAVGRRRAG
jgi:hypothetical protein